MVAEEVLVKCYNFNHITQVTKYNLNVSYKLCEAGTKILEKKYFQLRNTDYQSTYQIHSPHENGRGMTVSKCLVFESLMLCAHSM
jgi:hypothetical protein